MTRNTKEIYNTKYYASTEAYEEGQKLSKLSIKTYKDPLFFSHCIAEYLFDYCARVRNLSPATIETYFSITNTFISYIAESLNKRENEISISDITIDHINGFTNDLLDNDELSPASISSRLNVVKNIYHYFVRKSPLLMTIDIFQDIFDLGVEQRKGHEKVKYLTEEQLKLILSLPNKSHYRGYIHKVLLNFMYDSACRVQEICDIKMSDITFDQNMERYWIKVHGKGHKERNITLSTHGSIALGQYLEEIPKEKDDYLFTSHSGKQLTKNGIYKIVKKYSNLAKQRDPSFPDVHPHTFRHTWAMHMHFIGSDETVIGAYLGHSNPAVTTSIYSHATPEEVARETDENMKKIFRNTDDKDLGFKKKDKYEEPEWITRRKEYLKILKRK